MKYLEPVLRKIFGTKAFKRVCWYLKYEQPTDERFFDLAPVDSADPDGLYGKALDFAMQNAAIRNIALTGPYGSGKTSVIKTYEKNKHYRFLNVSLATFSDPNVVNAPGVEPPADEVTVKIERSILQQMLYGTDSSTLPYSRFKRISKPQWLSINAICFTGWIVACGLLYHEKDKLLATPSLGALEPLWIFISLYVVAYFAQLISRAHKASHSLSVKRLSLQNGEVELDKTPESSILNKHLDEIIYFFEENNYDAVIFEDLDRFGSPEIFIKLREINKIINDRPKRRSFLHRLKIAQPLKFLYAIKDDVFLNKDRAKFFDFITPIIPIINNSNSREMFAECISPKGAEIGIGSRFLSEVSLYLDDFRLIKNISNEFLVYRGKVGGDPNLEKLLSMIVYKNTYPKDFEELHHGKGALYRIVDQRVSVIAAASSQIDEDIERLKKLVASSEGEVCVACEDMVRIFWGHLCGNYQDNWIVGIYSGDSVMPYEELLNWQNFRKIFGEKSIRVQAKVYTPRYYQYQLQDVNIDSSFRELEQAVSPGLKFEDRYERVNAKNIQQRHKLNSEIEALKWRKSELARKPLRELIGGADVEIDVVALEHGINDSRLLGYLIKNGYLDETYHLYISIFHEGRMSRNDWNYIQAIRDFRSLDPNTQIDTPAEVIAEMREEDFGAVYVLNVMLMDHLLVTPHTNASKIQSALGYLSKRFAESEDFFSAYWMSGRAVDKLTLALAESWPQYATIALDSDQANKHVARILSFVPPVYLAQHMNTASKLSSYLSKNAQAIFSENINFDSGYSALALMSVKIADIKTIEGLPKLFSYVYENSLYLLNSESVSLVLEKFPGGNSNQDGRIVDCRIANYTAIKTQGGSPLIKYVFDNIDWYLEDVALALESNVSESEESIVEVMNHPDVDSELAIRFALKQDHVFCDFENIPRSMWGEMFFNGGIIVNWENILNYFSHEDCEKDRLIKSLDNEVLATNLSQSKIQIPKDDASIVQAFCLALTSNTTISMANFARICASIPYHYKSFPSGLPTDRRMILAGLRIVRLNEESFPSTSESVELRAALIRNSFDLYLGKTDIYPVGVDVKILLLSTVNEGQKSEIVKSISLEEIQSNAKALREVSRFFSRLAISTGGYSKEAVAYCLANAAGDGVGTGILMNFVGNLTDQQVADALKAAPEPYCNFVKPNVRQKIERTERHLAFVKALDQRDIISSVSDDGVTLRVNTYKKGFMKFLLGDN
ncbi:hypothetical protein [Phytopseudomonas seleniipraecipitans]|uniref:YobI family P-loop NTPase n=1 Tax=Phytopseudomonas seleniipraecipitans TaxID=640205 RepID=UPI00115F8238|nr:hypothetical protein [Pseudomonas seleniipraecipitans]